MTGVEPVWIYLHTLITGLIAWILKVLYEFNARLTRIEFKLFNGDKKKDQSNPEDEP